MTVDGEGVGFPVLSTFDNLHLKLLYAFVNAEEDVQGEVLRMQDAMGAGSECLASVRAAAQWLHDQDLPWLTDLSYASLERLLRLFCVNSHPCRSAGQTSGLLKWGTMINHACRPNVTYSSARGREAGAFEGKFMAVRPIAAGEILGVSYMSPKGALGSLAQRRRLLWFLKGFVCSCGAVLFRSMPVQAHAQLPKTYIENNSWKL